MEITSHNFDGKDIVPRELKGFNNILWEESMGGNAGAGHASVNGYYKNGEFVFWTGAHRPESDIYPRVIFKARMPDTRKLFEELKNKRPAIPSLISKIYTENADSDTAQIYVKRAVEHNYQMIEDYIRDGGNPDLLPDTDLIPDME